MFGNFFCNRKITLLGRHGFSWISKMADGYSVLFVIIPWHARTQSRNNWLVVNLALCVSWMYNPFYYIVESKILKIHRKIFSISSLVKISITWSFPANNFVFSKWRCLWEQRTNFHFCLKKKLHVCVEKNGNTTRKH